MSNLAIQPPTTEKQSKSGPPALRESFVAWARHIAKKDRLRVVFGGQPATNGKVMWLPSLPYNLTEQDLLMVRSDIMHESGHCTDTDFEFFTQFSRQHGPLAQSLLNSIEDVRIEIARAKRYPGATALIHDSNCLMMDTNRCRTGEADAAEALSTLCYMQGCVLRGWGGKHEEALQKAIGHLLNHLGMDAKPIIDQCIELLKADYPALGSTQDAGRLTLKVIALFQDASNDNAEGQDSNDDSEGEDSEGEGSSDESGDDSGDDDSSKDESSSGDDSGSDEGESGKGSGDSNDGDSSEGESSDGSQSGEGEGSEGESSEGSGDATGGTGTDSKSGSAKAGQSSNGKGKGTAAAIADMLNSDPGEEEVIDYKQAVEQLADEVSKGKRPEYKNSPVVPEHSADFSPEAKERAGASGVSDMSVVGSAWAEKDRAQYKRLERGVQAKANVMLGQLQALLRMATKAESQDSNRGRINARKLYRTSFDDDRVFKTTSQRVLPAAAVSVLCDLSGSMVPDEVANAAKVKSRLDQALQVQILLLKAMTVIGNPVELAGFGGSKRNVTTLAKTFDEHPMGAQQRIGGMVHEAGGGTPLAEALMHASMRLSAREERRKVMFIITDGKPKEPNDVVNLMHSCRNDGIHVVTFLIGFQAGQRPSYLNNQDVVFVPSIEDLSAKSLNVIKDVCLGS